MKEIKFIIPIISYIMITSCQTMVRSGKDNKDIIPLKEEMIRIPGGEFIFGHNGTDAYWEKEKWRPISVPIPPLNRKKIYLDTFYISKYETTNAQFNRFIEAGGYRKREYWDDKGWEFVKKKRLKVPKYWGKRISHVNSTMDYPNHPVLGTSWYEASAYARWRNMRLPTEEEWEKAARGTDERDWPWGDTFDKFRCNSKESRFHATTVVGGYEKGGSPYGVMDMCGNVYEFTSVYLPYSKENVKIYSLPLGESPGWVILKGGSWDDFGRVNKMWRRFAASVEERERGRHNGIRLVMDGE